MFKCISRLDGAMYAVKRTERKLQSEREKQEALREVQAMAGLGGGLGCEHIVRYFGAWMEYDHLYVQLELCDGTLADQFTASMRKAARDRERDERSGGRIPNRTRRCRTRSTTPRMRMPLSLASARFSS